MLTQQSLRSRCRPLVSVSHHQTYDHNPNDRASEKRDGDREVEIEVTHAARAYSLEVIALTGFCKGWTRIIAIVLVCVLAHSSARAASPEEYRVHASIERERGRVSGHLWVRVRVDAGEDQVRLWLYPDRLSQTPSTMDERSWRWVYPGEIDRGGIETHGVSVDGAPAEAERTSFPRGEVRGRDFAGADLQVAIPPSSTAHTVELELDFVVTVPTRFGRMGSDDGLLSLAAPWYPLVVGADDAWSFQVPHAVEVTVDDGQVALGQARFQGRGAVEEVGAYVPLIAADAIHDARVDAAGVELLFRSPTRMYVPPPASVPGEDGVIDLARIDVLSRTREVVGQAIETARAFGLDVPARIVLLQIPSRSELVSGAPNVLLFSDRLFQIFPIDQTLQFHRRVVRRAVLAHLAAPLGAVDRPSDRDWTGDLRAVALLDLDEARRHSGTATPQELLNLLSFHPAVDQLLYAPQIAFEDAYFAAIEERDLFRDDPARARRPLSRGRRILESARDALDEEALRRWIAMLVNGRRSARAALERAAASESHRLRDWLAATGEPVNYRLGDVRSEPAAGGYRHTIVVHRDGSVRGEPVEVLVEDEHGRRVTGVWDEPGPRGEVVIDTVGALAGVTVDPRHRLPQSPALADGHPRIDDATDHPWRPPILNGFLFNALVSEGDFTGLIDFALRRRYDLEHTIGLRAERTRAFTGGALRYSQGVGDKVHTNRRMGRLVAGLSFVRLHEFFGDEELGGWRTQINLGASVNTVRFSMDPREGFWGAASLTGGVAVRDDGTLGWTFRGGARGGFVLPLSLVNAFVFVGGGGFTAGEALASELQPLGGRTRLRGFESGELLGRGVVYGVVEHRWSALRDLAINLAHLVWVREIQLVVFAGGGAVFDRNVASTGRHDDVLGAADVGAGVRVHYEYGGVQPGVISFDLAYPLTRALTAREGDLVRSPVGFYIGFDQYF